MMLPPLPAAARGPCEQRPLFQVPAAVTLTPPPAQPPPTTGGCRGLSMGLVSIQLQRSDPADTGRLRAPSCRHRAANPHRQRLLMRRLVTPVS